MERGGKKLPNNLSKPFKRLSDKCRTISIGKTCGRRPLNRRLSLP